MCLKSRNYTNNNLSNVSCLCRTITILLILESLIEFASIIITEIYKNRCIKYSSITVGQLTNVKIDIIFLQLLSFQLLLFYLFGFVIVKRFFTHPEQVTSSGTLVDVLIGIFNLFLLTTLLVKLFIVIALYCSKHTIKESFGHAMFEGIIAYGSDMNIRLSWDEIQFHEGCCGIESYLDWKDAYAINNNNGVSYMKNLVENDNIVSVPISCCKEKEDCFSLPIRNVNISDEVSHSIENGDDSMHQDFETEIGYSSSVAWIYLEEINLSRINSGGCFPVLQNRYDELIFVTLTCAAILFFDGVCLILLLKLLVNYLKYRKCEHVHPESFNDDIPKHVLSSTRLDEDYSDSDDCELSGHCNEARKLNWDSVSPRRNAGGTKVGDREELLALLH